VLIYQGFSAIGIFTETSQRLGKQENTKSGQQTTHKVIHRLIRLTCLERRPSQAHHGADDRRRFARF
jgi:hypothetical protein